jgi:hypothetical protein
MTTKLHDAEAKEDYISMLKELVFVAYNVSGKPHSFSRNGLKEANTTYIACRECLKFFLIELEDEGQEYKGAPPYHEHWRITVIEDGEANKICPGSFLDYVSEEEWDETIEKRINWDEETNNLEYFQLRILATGEGPKEFHRQGYISVFVKSVG